MRSEAIRVLLTPDEHRMLDELANEQGVSRSDVVRRAIRDVRSGVKREA